MSGDKLFSIYYEFNSGKGFCERFSRDRRKNFLTCYNGFCGFDFPERFQRLDRAKVDQCLK
jgi:hypothetical protein